MCETGGLLKVCLYYLKYRETAAKQKLSACRSQIHRGLICKISNLKIDAESTIEKLNSANT